MIKLFRRIFTSIIVSFFLVSSASAVLIDFTDRLWSDVNGQKSTSHTVDDIGVTVSAGLSGSTSTNYWMTFNGNEGPGNIVTSDGSTLSGTGDGIGIQYIGDTDELNANCRTREYLMVSLDPAAIITQIFVLDLFRNEVASFSIDGTADTVSYTNSPAWGFREIDIAGSPLGSVLEFWVDPPGPGDDGDNDYALAGIMVSTAPVPEPSTLLLLGAGLVGLAGARRRTR